MDVIQRLNGVLAYSGQSIRAFSIKCGISQPTLDKQLKGLRRISIETMMSVLYTYPEISAEWLLLGIGSMLKEDRESQRINSLLDTITTLQDTINAKNSMIATLSERIKQLENQLTK